MNPYFRFLFLYFTISFFTLLSSAQDLPMVQKSTVIEQSSGVDYYIHTVEAGHTLYSIARVYAISIADLKAINPGLNPDLIPGQVIKIPLAPEIAPELVTEDPPDFDTVQFFRYHVLPGETLYHLSKVYNAEIAEIQRINDGLPGGLKAGTTILLPRKRKKIPVSASYDYPDTIPLQPDLAIDFTADNPGKTPEIPDTVYVQHEVQRRETLYGISRRYNISMDQIIRANPFLKENRLNKGDLLRVPQIAAVLKTEEVSPAVSYLDHKVEKGETTWSIAKKYNVTVEDILAANPKLKSGLKYRRTIQIPVFPKKYSLQEMEEPEVIEDVESGKTIVKITPAPESLCVKSRIYKQFNIALMLPLYLETVESAELPDNRFLRFIDFYKGVRIALDSLAKQGMNINLKVYDVDETPGKMTEAINDPSLQNADLIIGPLFRGSFSRMAEFARQHQIPIINPLTTSQDVLANNPTVFKVQVPEEIHLKLIAHSIRKQYPEANIVLVRNNSYQDSEQLQTVCQALNGKLKSRVLLPNSYLYNLLVEKSYADSTLSEGEIQDTIFIEDRMFSIDFLSREIMEYTPFPNTIHELDYSRDTVYGFKKYASLARKNIFISLTQDRVFTLEVLSQLNSLKDTFDISVYALPEVLRYEMESDFLSSMDLHVSGSGYLDYGNPHFEAFDSNYFNRWGSYPDNYEYAALAYDITMYFGTALFSYGTQFYDCLPNHLYDGLYMNFFFVGKEGQGYENGYASIYRIQDYRFIPEEQIKFMEIK